MTRALITHWTDYQAAIDQLLAMPCRKLCIYDEDLVKIRLDDRKRLAVLEQLLQSAAPGSIRVALRSAEAFRRTQTNLRDSMIILDDQHGLIRFDREQARSKLLINESDELRPYLQRFEEIWKEPGDIISATSLGL